MTCPSPKRRWFQFSLRTLLLVMVFAAAICGLFASINARAQKQREVVAMVDLAIR